MEQGGHFWKASSLKTKHLCRDSTLYWMHTCSTRRNLQWWKRSIYMLPNPYHNLCVLYLPSADQTVKKKKIWSPFLQKHKATCSSLNESWWNITWTYSLKISKPTGDRLSLHEADWPHHCSNCVTMENWLSDFSAAFFLIQPGLILLETMIFERSIHICWLQFLFVEEALIIVSFPVEKYNSASLL